MAPTQTSIMTPVNKQHASWQWRDERWISAYL
jgi:hypothetical protein